MKNIVKFIILVSYLLFSGMITAQSPPVCGGVNAPLPCWYTPDWQWWDATPANWIARIGTGSNATTTMSCPFYTNSNSDDMLTILNGLDYKPEQGWTLLSKDFGCAGGQPATNATPYFILYNKYKSVVRLFLFLGNPNSVNRASVILKWSAINSPTDNNSLLTLTNKYAKPNTSYPISYNPESHVNYLNQLASSGGWTTTEYQINFDPNTLINPGNFQFINFDFNVSNSSAISLSGDFNFTTQSATVKNSGTPTQHPSDPNLLDYVLQGQAALAKAPQKSQVVAGLNKISSKIDTIDQKFCNRLTIALHNVNQSFQNGKLKSFLLGTLKTVEDVGGALGTVAKVLDHFMNKSNTAVATNNESFVQPTISKGDMKLSGTIITEASPLNISLQLPGTSHKYSDGSFNCPNLPVYDCPLGVFSLQDAPAIEVRTWTEPERIGNFICSIDFDLPTGFCNDPPAPPSGVNQTILTATSTHTTFRRSSVCPASFSNRTVKSYKVTGDVKLAFNGAAGVNIESTKAALFFIIKKDNSNQPAINIFSDGPPPPAACCNPANQLPNNCTYNPATMASPIGPTSFNNITTYQDVVYKNYTKDLLNKNLLQLSDYDTSGYHKFQTPFVDIDKFKNTAVTIQEGVEVYLKILVVLRPSDLNDDQTPIIQSITYDIPAGKFNSNAGTTPYPITCAQKVDMDTVRIGQKNISSTIGNTLVAGYSIQTSDNSTLTANPTFQTNLEAYSCISLRSNFKAQTTAGSSFRAYINNAAGGCEISSNALVLTTHTFNCTNNASNHRLMHFTETENSYNEGAKILENPLLEMSVAPNPNNGVFNLIFNQSVENGTLKIANAMGQEIYQTTLEGGRSTYELNLVEFLTSGAYVISWNSTKFVMHKKFIVN